MNLAAAAAAAAAYSFSFDAFMRQRRNLTLLLLCVYSRFGILFLGSPPLLVSRWCMMEILVYQIIQRSSHLTKWYIFCFLNAFHHYFPPRNRIWRFIFSLYFCLFDIVFHDLMNRVLLPLDGERRLTESRFSPVVRDSQISR